MPQNNIYMGKPVQKYCANEIVQFPELNLQTFSMTPLERMQLALLIVAIKPEIIIETGVWRGLTTRFLSETLALNHISGQIIGFDLPEVIEELLASDDYYLSAGNIQFEKGLLPESLQGWLKSNQKRVDLAIIDADHNYFSAITELCAVEPYLDKDGYIFCHDYGLDNFKHEGVVCAIDDFCRNYGFTILPLQSRPSSPKTERSAQSAILHRKIHAPLQNRLYHWKMYIKRKYFTKPEDVKLFRLV